MELASAEVPVLCSSHSTFHFRQDARSSLVDATESQSDRVWRG